MMPERGKSEAIMGYTITPTELKSRLDKGDQLVLLDVREPWEFDLAKLNGSTLIPLATLPQCEEPGGWDRCLVSASGPISPEILVAARLRDARDGPWSMYARLKILDCLLQAIDQIGSRLPG